MLKLSAMGTVLRLQCKACGAVFPHFVFSALQGIDPTGLCSASSCRQNEVVIVEAKPDKWQHFEEAGVSSIEEWLAQKLGPVDLKVLRLLRVESQTSPAAGLSFGDFKKGYKSPVRVYSCACCAKGESRTIEELTVSDFQKSGGKIHITEYLTL